MAIFGEPSLTAYPGTYTPTWWTTSNVTTANVQILPAAFGSSVDRPPPEKPKPRTNVEWLRERVAEMCELEAA